MNRRRNSGRYSVRDRLDVPSHLSARANMTSRVRTTGGSLNVLEELLRDAE